MFLYASEVAEAKKAGIKFPHFERKTKRMNAAHKSSNHQANIEARRLTQQEGEVNWVAPTSPAGPFSPNRALFTAPNPKSKRSKRKNKES